MTDLICRKTMQRCQTPGMCRPHGGCRPDQGFESGHMDLGKFVDWVWSLKAERDQLKAENAQLKNHEIELKAENEALRKDAERYRWLREPWQDQRQVRAWTSLEVMDENIDAAMAKESSHD